MDYSEEIDLEVSQRTVNLDPITIELIKLSERIKIFAKLRNLINQKDYENDEVASAILGWAYERMAED